MNVELYEENHVITIYNKMIRIARVMRSPSSFHDDKNRNDRYVMFIHFVSILQYILSNIDRFFRAFLSFLSVIEQSFQQSKFRKSKSNNVCQCYTVNRAKCTRKRGTTAANTLNTITNFTRSTNV